MTAPVFFLGVHEPYWLAKTDVPLFVSRRRLERIPGRWPRALGLWAMDSGGFSELSIHGKWKTTPQEYLACVEKATQQCGNLAWVAPQDWMCEPPMLAKTGKTVLEHQLLTVENFLELQRLTGQSQGPSSNHAEVIPVLQGWTAADYLRCIDLYRAAGVALERSIVVGVGTVCRRQGTADAVNILTTIQQALPEARLHGFGFKTLGLRRCASFLHSADSMAWSLNARKHPPMPGHLHKTCSNCLAWALDWRERVVAEL